MRLTVRIPPEAGRVSPERLKKLVDGTVSAFQRHEASTEAVQRIAARLSREPEQALARLSDPTRWVLGLAERPIGLTSAEVQWDPDDTRVVAAEITVEVGISAGWATSSWR
jgi:hypothetical protein